MFFWVSEWVSDFVGFIFWCGLLLISVFWVYLYTNYYYRGVLLKCRFGFRAGFEMLYCEWVLWWCWCCCYSIFVLYDLENFGRLVCFRYFWVRIYRWCIRFFYLLFFKAGSCFKEVECDFLVGIYLFRISYCIFVMC